ncbi:MAG: phosphate acetyltransferase [Phycisphaerae bacterium]|nr:phosphate acetyltransferase [Phycisphaerae bacterium]
MSNVVVNSIIERARQADACVILPEASDPRVLHATERVLKENYARITLLGDPDAITKLARAEGAKIDGAEIVNPLTDSRRDAYVEALYEKRKAKGMTRPQADEMLRREPYYGGMMIGDGRAGGMVCGSICPTADTVRAALFGVGLAEGIKTVSACSIMNTIVEEIGVDGSVIFADTGVLPEPTVEQLADIGIAAAAACRSLLNTEPYVAMLSFSTKGSAHSPAVQKVIDATELIKKRRPDLNVDGELQLDAAVIPAIGKTKAKGSPVAGKANTLVFPDLSCGNIAYKLVERLGKATALGPLLMGTAKPINDLSRGCSVEDIALITAITVVQSL